MISVVHVITSLDAGGAESTLLRLVSRFDRTRFSCAVVSLTGPGSLAAQFAALDIPLYVVGSRRSVGPSAIWRLLQVIRRHHPAILQTWLYHADLLGLLAGRACGVPVVGWNVRCAELNPRDHSRSLFWVLRTLARLSRIPQFVVVNSNAGRRAHAAIGYRPRRWELIPNGFDTDTFAPSEEARRAVREERRIPDNAPVVGLIARYHAMKDHATFLHAAARIVAARPDVQFILAGRLVDGTNGELVGLIEKLGLTSCAHLLGEVSRPARLMAGLDVAVSSSYSEGFPNVVAEAMAVGVPVVATDAGDTARIVGDTGTVVPCRDASALAAAVAETLALDPDERRRRGLAGRQRIVGEFSLEAVVSRYEQLYLELAATAAQVN